MNVDGNKFKSLIEWYGTEKNYEKKSHTRRFCEDFDLNYIQFHAYTKETQNVGIKIIYRLMDIFPNLNMNWLLKDDPNMFTHESGLLILSEPKATYNKKVTNEDLMEKLNEIHSDLKKQR
ncbi:MAG: hypothetical protein RLZZ540_2250 [Bacteroidota bacterium]|jgi:hypothetical protein